MHSTRNSALNWNSISSNDNFFTADPVRIITTALDWLHVHIEWLPHAWLKQARTGAGMKRRNVTELFRNWTCPLSSLCANREHACVRLATAHEHTNSNSDKKCLFPSLSQKNWVISSWTRALLPWFTLSSVWLLQPTAPWAAQMQNKELKNQAHSWRSSLRNAFVYETRVRLILVHQKCHFRQSLGNNPANFSWADPNGTMEKVSGRSFMSATNSLTAQVNIFNTTLMFTSIV